MEKKSEINQLVDHLFRHESGKMIAVLTGIFGSENLIHAEDIVQDTLIEALNNWTYKGIPKNPVAWLYRVAKNKTINALKREQHLNKYILENSQLSSEKQIAELQTEEVFSTGNISDDQLRLMFVCCHPSISKDSQTALILKTLCGFSIGEIAKAFLTNNESVNKRLVRARKKIRTAKIPFDVPKNHELNDRVDTVLEAIYLLFNEGYSASTGTMLIRKDLCEEAIRLTEIVVSHTLITQKSNVQALLALMQLNSSRFKAREDKQGNIVTLSQQDRSLWDLHLMEKGFSNLKRCSTVEQISKYHLLAAISSYHCSSKNFESTDWQSILTLYDRLLSIDNSPIVVFNRAIILSKANSVKRALRELEKIQDEKIIQSNYLFYSTKTEFHFQLNELEAAKEALSKAIELAPLHKEKEMLQNRYFAYFDK